jgi:hypothetical protein
MTTATTSRHRPFPTSFALAAASAAVVVGGLTAFGISEARDGTAPTQSTVNTSTTHVRTCHDTRCLSRSHRHGYGTRFGSHEPALKGGHTAAGLP